MSAGRSVSADEIVDALEALDQLRDRVALTYQCRDNKRCGLVRIIPTPEGTIAIVKRYKTAPGRNADTSTSEGRAKYTEDGDRRWREQRYFIDESAGIGASCDHFQDLRIEVAEVRADLKAQRRLVRIPR